jgi:hypothetical protein
MFTALKNQMTEAFKSNQAVVCTYKRRQYLLVDIDTYWNSAWLVRNTPESIARYNANDLICGDELSLNDFELEDIKVLGLATAP